MNYEKKYKEALERARVLNDGKDVDIEAGTTTCEYIFPELKESEDERIRKELIEQVAYIIPNDDEVDSEGDALSTYQKRIDKYRAWLEKQGHMLEPDKVIKWLKTNMSDDSAFGMAMITQFKEDFGLLYERDKNSKTTQ